jgi:hypothetical protein
VVFVPVSSTEDRVLKSPLGADKSLTFYPFIDHTININYMCHEIRVARLYISKPKFPIWVNFGESCAMEEVGIFYGYLVNFSAIWNILWSFGIFAGYLVYFSRFGIL